MFYETILRAIGLLGVIDTDISKPHNADSIPNIIVDIENGNRVHVKENEITPSFFIKHGMIINIIYFSFVGLILLWPCIFTIYDTAVTKQFPYFTSNIFKFLVPTQYIFGIIYYTSPQFKKNMKVFEELDQKLINVMFIINIILSICLAILTIVLLNVGVYMNVYWDLYVNKTPVEQTFIGILIFITQAYSYSVILANTILFAIIFYNHSRVVKRYVGRLENFVKFKDVPIIDIINDLDTLRTNYANSVNGLNNMFTSIIIIGLISVYFVVINFGTLYTYTFSYIESVLVVANILGYIYSINNVNNTVGDIGDIMNTMEFNAIYLDRQPFIEISGDIPMHQHNVEVNDPSNNDIEKLRQTVENAKSIVEFDSITLNFIKGVVLRTMVRNLENSNSSDWQILSNKLNQSWQCFQLLGYSIYGSSILSNMLAIGLMFYGSIGLGTKFGIVP